VTVNRVLLGILLLGTIVGLLGCTTTYVPDGRAADPKLIPSIPGGKRIALINGQPATESVLIGEAGMGRSVRGNLHTWTDQAIVALKDTLKKKGVEVSDRSDKSLKVVITKAALSEAGSGWAFRCTVDFTIETSDGRVVKLVADDTSWKFLNACDGVITKVALVALKDERIVKFLADP